MNKIYHKKEYLEVNAILRLKKYWREYIGKFKKSESPDWKNDNCGIGIEVVRLISSNEGERLNITRKYLGKNKKCMKEKELEKFEKKLYCDENDKIYAMSPYEQPFINKKVISDTYRNKLTKLNNNYKVYNKNCIYLFCNNPIEESDINDIFEIIEEEQSKFLSKNEYIFDYIFIDCWTFIGIIDYKKKKIEKIDMDMKLLKDDSKINELLETEFK